MILFLQVHSNGFIYIDSRIGLLRPRPFGSIASEPFIAPYWVDNDPSMGGNVSYEVHTGDSPSLNRVSCSISRRENVDFRGTWMLVVFWFNVPVFEDNNMVSRIFMQLLNVHLNILLHGLKMQMLCV